MFNMLPSPGLLILLLLLVPASSQGEQPDLASLMSNLVSLQTSELTLIVGNKSESTVDQLKIIQGCFEYNQLPIYLYDIQGTLSFPKVDCQAKDLESQEYHKADNRRSLVFFSIVQNIKDLDVVVRNLLGTVINCPSRQAGGYFRNENIFAFYGVLPDQAWENLFHTYETRRHPHIALFNPLSTNDGLLMDRYDVHTDTIRTSSLWRKGQYEYETIRSLFPWIDMSGYTLKVSSIPFSYLCYADYLENPSDPRKAYANYAGYDVSNKILCTVN